MGTRVGSITFGGLSSGLKTDELITKLLDVERGPITQLQTRRDGIKTRLDILRDLNTKTLALRDALRELDNRNLIGTDASVDEEFSRFAASSSDAGIATASVTGKASASVVNLRVTQLASAARFVENEGFANLTDTVGTGSFQIDVGTDSTVLNITGANNTVQGFVNAINNSGADVSAFILNDGSGTPFRIVIQGKSTGDANDVAITSGLAGGSPQSPTFTETQNAQDAIAVIDPNDLGAGVTVHSSTNTFTELLQGLTVQVHAINDPDVPSDKIAITVEADDDAVVTAIQDVVDKFNAIVGIVNEQAVIDPNTNRGGPLLGDSTLSTLQQRLGRVLASQIGSGSVRQAGQIGLKLDQKGQLSLDAAALRARLEADPAAVRNFFAGADSFSDQLRSVAQSFVDPVDGLLVARINGGNQAVTDLETQISSANDRLSVVEDGLVRQFAALEHVLSGIQLQGNFLSQFLLQNQRG